MIVSRACFEIRHLVAAPATLWVLWQFIAIMWMMRNLPKVVVYPFGVAFLLQDAIYNMLAGSFIFWERPREILFTDRVKRHLVDSDCPASRFAVVLNYFDPGHV